MLYFVEKLWSVAKFLDNYQILSSLADVGRFLHALCMLKPQT